MSVVIDFRKDNISPEDVLRYFFHQINASHNLDISLSDPRIKAHIPALKCLAKVYIDTANPGIQDIPEACSEAVCRELNHLRARFLAETVLGVLIEESIVRLKS